MVREGFTALVGTASARQQLLHLLIGLLIQFYCTVMLRLKMMKIVTLTVKNIQF